MDFEVITSLFTITSFARSNSIAGSENPSTDSDTIIKATFMKEAKNTRKSLTPPTIATNFNSQRP